MRSVFKYVHKLVRGVNRLFRGIQRLFSNVLLVACCAVCVFCVLTTSSVPSDSGNRVTFVAPAASTPPSRSNSPGRIGRTWGKALKRGEKGGKGRGEGRGGRGQCDVSVMSVRCQRDVSVKSV